MTLTGPSPAAIQSEMLNQEVRDQWTEVGLAHGQGSLAGADPASVEGVITCHNYAESMQNEQNQQMMQSYYTEFGDDSLANYMTGPAYVSIKLIEQAVEETGDTSPSAIKEALPSTGFDNSVVGEASFDEDHQLNNDAVAKQMSGDMIHEVIKQFDSVSPENSCDTI
jgi:ABC-type branched-subunit amino acid transport system substrate-binding protein